MNAEIALFRAGIPFLQLPFQQNKFASNLFMVLNVSKARACLQRAGFQTKFDSETVLFDSCNGQPDSTHSRQVWAAESKELVNGKGA